MAPPQVDKIYLPDLEPCLKGERVVISWKHVASALADSTGHRQASPAILDFLTSSQVCAFFTKPGTVFEALSPSVSGNDLHRQAFEARTSAVQVIPTPNEKYDIKTVKEDAIWLSKNVNVNPLAALRVVVIEFQSRACSQLNGAISSQDVANLQEAAGAATSQAMSNILPGLNWASVRDVQELQADFDKPESRRFRIFQTYLSERRHFAMATDLIFTLMLQERLPNSPTTEATTQIRLAFLEAFGLTSQMPITEAPKKTHHALVAKYFALLTDSIKACQSLTSIAEDQSLHQDDMHLEWMRTFLSESIHAMTVAFQLLDLSKQILVTPDLLSQWFAFVRDIAFLDQLPVSDALSDLVEPAQCLICTISLLVLNLARALPILHGEVEFDSQVEYIGSSEALQLIHQIISIAAIRNTAIASPLVFAWVPILHGMWASYQERTERRDALQNQKAIETYDSGTQMIPGAGRRNSNGSITTIDKSGYDEFLMTIQLERDIEPAQKLATIATRDGVVYDVISFMAKNLGTHDSAFFAASVGARMRLVFLELLEATNSYVGYKDEPVNALLNLLSGGDGYWEIDRASSLLPRQHVISCVLENTFVVDFCLYQALNRFPYEFSPFIGLCRNLCSPLRCSGNDQRHYRHDLVTDILQRTPTLTFELPPDFNNYELVQEEENSNSFRLLEDLPLIVSTSNIQRANAFEEMSIIPAGTLGRFIVDSGRVVLMEYPHSALAMLGRRLHVTLGPSLYRQELGDLGPDETVQVIALLTTLIRSESLKVNDQEAATMAGLALLAETSRDLPNNKDIFSVICDVLDFALEQEPDVPATVLVAACIRFLDSVLYLCPGRVWSYMAKCALLSDATHSSRLSKFVGSLDVSDILFDLLISTVRLFSRLADSVVASAVQRRAIPKSSGPRQKFDENMWLGVSDKLAGQITTSIAHVVVDILENVPTWKFSANLNRVILIRDLVPMMSKVVLYTYSLGEVTSKIKLAASFEPAAKYFIDSFLAPAAGSLRIQPLLAAMISAPELSKLTLYPNAVRAIKDRTNAVLDLAITLVRISNLFDQSSTTIEQQLFKATPFMARLSAAHDSFRTRVTWLLDALVASAGKSTGEPPSLLGHLGLHVSSAFLEFLSTLDKPFDQPEEVETIWRLFSTIVRNRQQWMSNCLLTGKSPREARHGLDKKTQSSHSSVLASALDRLISISSIPAFEAMAILDFVNSAQNYWAWTVFDLLKNSDFTSSLRRYVRELKSSAITAKSDTMHACRDARIAAYIAETFAMQLFHLRQLGAADALAKELAKDLDYYLREGALVSGYNMSLHANFAKNFKTRYPGCSLDDFKRTLLEPRSLGVKYYYTTSLADKMLAYDSGWMGPRNNGFKKEMEKANVNLSLVDAQVALYHAWEFLLLELSNCLPKNNTLNKQTLQVAEQCLEANQATQGHEQIFERLAESRATLAFMLVQRVVDNAPLPGDVAQLLNSLWSTVSSMEASYSKDNILLHRTLLKLLYVTLRAQARAFQPQGNEDAAVDHQSRRTTAMVSQAALNILENTVAKGFRSLVSLIHDRDESIFPADVAILTAIMQSCICMPGMNKNQTQIVNIMATQDAVHVALSLYSWADKLTTKGDPVYGELALLFLLELSALPQVAEQLACDGLLNHLTSATLASYLNRPNVSPFDDSASLQRCYSMWAKAVVPLLLNVLKALESTIAAEVAYVLNQFPHLMTSSVARFEAPGASRTAQRTAQQNQQHITLLAVSEIHSLALTTRILSAIRADNRRDVSEVAWDAGALLENVEFWLGSRKMLRERIVPLGAREVEWKAMKPSEQGRTKGCESALEERVVEQMDAVRIILSEDLE